MKINKGYEPPGFKGHKQLNDAQLRALLLVEKTVVEYLQALHNSKLGGTTLALLNNSGLLQLWLQDVSQILERQKPFQPPHEKPT